VNQPDNKIREVTNAKLNENGLNPETATRDQVTRSLKAWAHLSDNDVVPIFSTKPDGDALKVAITVPNNNQPLQERLKKAVSGLTDSFRKGMVSALWNDSLPMERYNYDMQTVSFDIEADKEPELIKTLARFLNTEAKQEVEHYQSYGGRKPTLLARISEIQNGGAGQIRQ
jgi:hypothetical protein